MIIQVFLSSFVMLFCFFSLLLLPLLEVFVSEYSARPCSSLKWSSTFLRLPPLSLDDRPPFATRSTHRISLSLRLSADVILCLISNIELAKVELFFLLFSRSRFSRQDKYAVRFLLMFFSLSRSLFGTDQDGSSSINLLYFLSQPVSSHYPHCLNIEFSANTVCVRVIALSPCIEE